MIYIITIVILLVCVLLAFFILVQNPKGGGLTGAFGSIGTQVMGVKQSTDVMEKGTWTTMGIIAALCIVSVIFYESPRRQATPSAPAQTSAPAPQPAAPAGGTQPAQ